MTFEKSNCCAVCVTYHPRLPVLKDLVNATIAQVDRIILVDNGSADEALACFETGDAVEIIALGKNGGIAAGFNVGILRARDAGYAYVLLLDQDSIPPAGMIRRYLEAMHQLAGANKPVAAVGPRYRNARLDHTSRFVRFGWFHNIYCGSDSGPALVRADFLISSGSFFDLRVFAAVGLFKEGLFIDHVDTEWCNRARSLGFLFYGIWDVVMEHSLGERDLRLWFLRWRVQPIHQPFRLYFIMRNSILMYRDPNVGIRWLSGDILRLMRLAVVYLVCLPPRNEHAKWLSLGLLDGLRKVTGGGRVFSLRKHRKNRLPD